MGKREFEIIAKARTTLNDKNSNNYRWSDENLMEKLEEGQRYMCKRIPLLMHDATVHLVGGQLEYYLPDDCIKIIRAKSHGTDFGDASNILPLLSYDEIEEQVGSWEDDYSGSVSSLIVNSLSQHKIRPYPALANGSVYDIKCRYQALPTNLNYTIAEGIMPIEDGIQIDENTYSYTENELEISTMWDYALQQYVIGQAFIDYGDTSSDTRAATAMSLFNNEFLEAKKLAKKGFSKRIVTLGYSARVSPSYGGSRECNTNNRSY